MSSISASGLVEIEQIGSTIQYRINGGSPIPITYSDWPVSIVNTDVLSTLKIHFITDITLTSITPNCYFFCTTPNIQFGNRSLGPDGSRPIITIDGTTNYLGLIKNGTPVLSGFSSIYICNLEVAAVNGTTLANGGGWIAQQAFAANASNNIILNCASSGTIADNGGGCVGANAADNSGNLVLIHCSSSGAVGQNGGGIVGANAASAGGYVRCEECFSSGPIGQEAGGIIGSAADNVEAVQCYSKGPIAIGGGGIFGSAVLNGKAIQCYSEGSIDAAGGGIFGSGAGQDTGAVNSIASNCYSIGTIGIGAGGIYGATYNPATVSALNCYTSGASSGSSGGIYAGSNTDTPGSNKSETNAGLSGWKTINANNTLVPTEWISVGSDQPFLIREFGYSLYTTDIITEGYGIVKVYADTVVAGDSTNSAVISGYTFVEDAVEPSITVNPGTGQLSTTTMTPPGLYIFYVLATKNPYHHIVIELTVDGPSPPPQPSCCPTSKDLTGLPQEIYTQAQAGRVLIAERIQNPNVRFASYADYITYKKTLALKRSS